LNRRGSSRPRGYASHRGTVPDQGKQSRTYQLADMGTEHYDDAVISMLRLPARRTPAGVELTSPSTLTWRFSHTDPRQRSSNRTPQTVKSCSSVTVPISRPSSHIRPEVSWVCIGACTARSRSIPTYSGTCTWGAIQGDLEIDDARAFVAGKGLRLESSGSDAGDGVSWRVPGRRRTRLCRWGGVAGRTQLVSTSSTTSTAARAA
jgi:hypothetical protein